MWSWLFESPSPLHDPSLVRVTGTIREHKIGDETITIDLEIENTQDAKSIAPFTVTIKESKYWHIKRVHFSSGLAPLSIHREVIQLGCQRGASRFDVDRYIKAVIYRSDGSEEDGRELSLEWTHEAMVMPFQVYAAVPPDVPMTILLVGSYEANRTALLRTLLTAGSRGHDISNVGNASSFGEQGRLESYSMGDLRNVQIANVLGETRPYDIEAEERYDKVKYAYDDLRLPVLDGALPREWSTRDEIAEPGRPALLNRFPKRRYLPTSFIYVLSATELDNDYLLDKEARYFSKLAQKTGHEGVICLTCIELLVPEAREFPMAMYPEIEELKTKVARVMEVPLQSVYSVVSYTGPPMVARGRQYDIDRCSGIIIEASMKQSLQYAKSRGQTLA